jgi:SAM-dependent methyltransferase
VSKVFNSIYDLFMSQQPYAKYAQCYLRAIGDRDCSDILEAGCGSGLFIKAMNDLGLKPAGLDRDKQMLKLAKKRTSAHVYHGDICSFSSEKRWDVIYLPLDVLNYLSRYQLKKALTNLALILKEDGIIVFDVHGRKRARVMHGAFAKESINDAQYLLKSRRRGSYLVYDVDSKFNGKQEKYRLKQRIHSVNEIKWAIRRSNLVLDDCFRAWDLGVPNRHAERLLFVCSKKQRH